MNKVSKEYKHISINDEERANTHLSPLSRSATDSKKARKQLDFYIEESMYILKKKYLEVKFI